MKFFYRYRKATSLVSLTALVAGMTVAPAAAEYDPRTGRFLQRDQHGTGVVLQPSLPYHAANPTVTVSMAYELQFADGMSFYQFVRSNPINRTDPSGLFSLVDLLSTSAIRVEMAALTMAAAYPLATRFAAGLVAAANLYAFAQYEEVQAIVLSQPNPLGFLAGEGAALRLAVGELVGTRGSITALSRASASTQELLTASTAFVRRSTLSFKPFTQANFRENLGILTGAIRKGFDAHHVFPIKFIEEFQAAGIDIHDPIYGAWWAWRSHRGTGKAYNDVWKRFFITNPSREQMLQKGRELAHRFGFQIQY